MIISTNFELLELDQMEVIQGKIGTARQISFEQLRNDIVLYEHQSFAASIFFSFQLADSEWPVHQQILFALAYGIAMYRIARKLQKGRQPLFDPFLYRYFRRRAEFTDHQLVGI